MMQPTCPECDALVEFSADSIVGEILECEACSVELEITGLAPAAVAVAPEVEEDWGE